MTNHKQNQRGAVSIFVVVFSALFVTIITVGFVGIMVRGQQQATNADLSNSAYDAAMAGVEDAKRVLLKYRECALGGFTAPTCMTLKTKVDSQDCNTVKFGLTGDPTEGETLIQSSNVPDDENSKSLDQAYTCVTIDYTAPSKELVVRDGESVVVPIESNGEVYDKLNISWFLRDTGGGTSKNLAFPAVTPPQLPTKDVWNAVGANAVTPPIVRAQLIQHGVGFNASDFDADSFDGAAVRSNTNSVFLYPTANPGVTSTSFELADERDGTNPLVKGPQIVSCPNSRYVANQYTCSVDIALPQPKGDSSTRSAYMRLSALYSSTKVRLTLLRSGSVVPLVAPTVDSTGRANDLFRRVKVGVSFNGDYPRANFDVKGDLCKNFSVTNDASGFDAGGCNLTP